MSHEQREVSNSSHWHGIVHRNSNSWAEWVSFDLNDSYFLGFLDEEFFQFGVSTLNSENHVDSTSNFLIHNFGGIVSIAAVDKVPQDGASLLRQFNIGIQTTILIHISCIESCHVHWIHSWSVVVCILGLLVKLPIAQYWSVWLSMAE